MKYWIKNTPVLRSLAGVIFFIAARMSYPGSRDYWARRYKSGGNSGIGSYDKFAAFKSEVLNSFVADKQVKTIIDYGCGDGNQLRLAEYESYIGFDVSPDAIMLCKRMFFNDETKTFKMMDDYAGETAELTLSLDVIYHLTEDKVYYSYMNRLFDSAAKFVTIYSSNTDKQARLQSPHVRHRKFSTWVDQNRPEWKLIQFIPNRYPYSGNWQEGSFADFYVYEKA